MLFYLFGIAFLGVKYGLWWNNNNNLNGRNFTCPEGKVMVKLSNHLLCFDRIDSCPNGFIGSAGTCNCFAGKDTEGSCLKICSNCDDNGWCSSAEKCECKQGFKMSKDIKCEPICESHCPKNGFCSVPGVCSCIKGYKISKDNKCEPICRKFCPKNGFCSAPDVCSCKEGYRFVKNQKKCKPICSKKCSKNSHCSAPNECSCNKGYLKIAANNTCIPDCEDKCFDGKCISPGNCICNEGFIKDFRDGECVSNIIKDYLDMMNVNDLIEINDPDYRNDDFRMSSQN